MNTMCHSKNIIKPMHIILLLLTIYIADGHSLTAKTPANFTTYNIIITNIYRNDISSAVKLLLNLNDNNQISRIVKDSYVNNAANTENILSFIGALPTFFQRGIGYTELLSQMKNNNQLNQYLALGFWIKETLKLFNFPGVLTTDLENSRLLFENLKEALPRFVKLLLFHPVCLRNKNFQEYMYASTYYYGSSSSRRSIVTLRGGQQAGEKGIWKFESSDGKYFKIMNNFYKQYMSVSANTDDSYDDYRRRVFTFKEGPMVASSDWKISIVDLDKKFIFIQEKYRDEYLYSPDFVADKTKRYVLTWKPYITIANCHKCIWEVVSC